MLCTMAAPLRQRRDADYRTLLAVESVPCEWLEVEVPEEGFVLGVVEFHWVKYIGTITKMPYSSQY